jgi:hypothetical protein
MFLWRQERFWYDASSGGWFRIAFGASVPYSQLHHAAVGCLAMAASAPQQVIRILLEEVIKIIDSVCTFSGRSVYWHDACSFRVAFGVSVPYAQLHRPARGAHQCRVVCLQSKRIRTY